MQPIPYRLYTWVLGGSLVTEQTRGGVDDIPCALGVPYPVLGSPCPLLGKDILECQRLVKRKDIIYLKNYMNLRVIT